MKFIPTDVDTIHSTYHNEIYFNRFKRILKISVITNLTLFYYLDKIVIIIANFIIFHY